MGGSSKRSLSCGTWRTRPCVSGFTLSSTKERLCTNYESFCSSSETARCRTNMRKTEQPSGLSEYPDECGDCMEYRLHAGGVRGLTRGRLSRERRGPCPFVASAVCAYPPLRQISLRCRDRTIAPGATTTPSVDRQRPYRLFLSVRYRTPKIKNAFSGCCRTRLSRSCRMFISACSLPASMSLMPVYYVVAR